MKTIVTRAVFTMKNSDGVECAALVHNVTPKADYYSAPGGEMKSGEPLTETIIQYVKEQCGVIVMPDEILFSETTDEFKDMYFLCNYVSGDFEPIDEAAVLSMKTNRSEGTSEPVLVPLSEVKHLYLLPEKLKTYLRKKA